MIKFHRFIDFKYMCVCVCVCMYFCVHVCVYACVVIERRVGYIGEGTL